MRETINPPISLTEEREAQRLLRDSLGKADIPCCFPLSGDEVLSLLRHLEFDVCRDRLETLIAGANLRQQLGIKGDRWSAVQVFEIIRILDFRQQWCATPCRHDFKKHPLTILIEKGEAPEEVRKDIESTDLRSLLSILEHAEQAELRSRLCCVVRAKLALQGVSLDG